MLGCPLLVVRFMDAHVSCRYTLSIEAAETAEEKCFALLNRSWANLNLERPDYALADAELAMRQSPSCLEKALFRQARALYEQGNFRAALQSFKGLLILSPNNTDARIQAVRAERRFQEELFGSYAASVMTAEAEERQPYLDCATFSAAVEVKQSPGRGLGLFVKLPVIAGQLVLCEKAFGYSH